MSDSAPGVAVIGGGIFGCTTALALADAGFRIELVELKDDLLLGATKNNFNRVHYGYHYPRDIDTAIQSKNGFNSFVGAFSECLTTGFPNYYFVADENSKTSPTQYLAFCEKAGLERERVGPGDAPLEIRKCSLGVKANEVVYDHDLLRARLKKDLQARPAIGVKCGAGVEGISRREDGFRLILTSGEKIDCNAVVNCAYVNINALNAMLGHGIARSQYEYTVVPIVETGFARVGVAVMDGLFPSLMPYGRKDLSLLYHVEQSVIATEVSDRMNPLWLRPDLSPFHDVDKAAYFRRFKEACAAYLPAVAGARLAGFLEGPRMVMAYHEDDDARPSLINKKDGNRYLTVFSGKVDHSLQIAAQVVAMLREAI